LAKVWWLPFLGHGVHVAFPAVFEILGFKRIGETNLAFQGHVTSSIT